MARTDAATYFEQLRDRADEAARLSRDGDHAGALKLVHDYLDPLLERARGQLLRATLPPAQVTREQRRQAGR